MIVPVCPIGYRKVIKDGQFAGCEDDPDFPSWLGFLKGSVGPMPVGGIAAGGTLPQAGGQAAGEAAKQALGKLAEACGTLLAYWLGQQVQTNVQTNTANPQNNRAITVFRGERASMTPQIAFTVGITPKGGNTNLIEHLTSNTANSYYIAISKSLWIAFGYAGKNGYVYVIRTSRGIDINQVLGSAAPYPEQQEVSVPGGVFPSEIAGAMPKQQGVLTGQFIPNPGFILR